MENNGNGGERRFRVGIVGSYGGLNLGDEAILAGILKELRAAAPIDVTVFSRNPSDTLKRHRVDRAVPVREMSRDEVRPEIERLDLLIVGGGGILFDAEAALYLREAALAADRGIPVMVYAVSAGPLNERHTQATVRETLNRAQVITVRDRQARKILEDVGVTREILVTADPALLLEPEPLPDGAMIREGLDRQRRLVGMSVREPGPAAPDLEQNHYHQLLADAADFVVERFDADVVFIPMEQRMLDLQQSHAVVARMANAQRASILKDAYTSGQLLTLMSHFEFAVGMRLHFLIFAALQRIPFVALPYATKVSGFLEDLQMEAPPMQHVTAGRLLAHVDRSWDSRKQLKERIDRVLPALQERARETNKFAVHLLQMPAVGR
jgi:polysaccharide pyruvyl transferase CsaB